MGLALPGLLAGFLQLRAFRPVQGLLGLAGLLLDVARLGELVLSS